VIIDSEREVIEFHGHDGGHWVIAYSQLWPNRMGIGGVSFKTLTAFKYRMEWR